MAKMTIPMAELPQASGKQLGYTEWHTVTQERVNQFADTVNDHQFIHVDPERAKDSPFGGTIAHGYLTVTLAAEAVAELMEVPDASMEINYGLDRVRFPAPLPVGKPWRANVEIAEVSEIPGGFHVKTRCSLEVDGGDKPACIVEALSRFYH